MTAIFQPIDEVVSQQEQHLSVIHNALGAIAQAHKILVTTSPAVHKAMHSALAASINSLGRVVKTNAKLAADLNKAAKEEEASE